MSRAAKTGRHISPGETSAQIFPPHLLQAEASTYPKAVANGTDPLTAHTRPHLAQHSLNHRLHAVRQMARRPLQPRHKVEGGRAVQRDWITVEQVWHDDEVAVRCQLVGYQLGINEAVPDYIGE